MADNGKINHGKGMFGAAALTFPFQNIEISEKLSALFSKRYSAEGNNETHGIGWKIWACLNVGPQTGYLPTEESFKLIQQPDVQSKMKRLFKIVFDNDRAVADGIMEILNARPN